MRSWQLGASLYVPAIRPDLVEIANRRRFPNLRSVIFCTEDAVRETELPQALTNLGRALPMFETATLLRFVRARSPAVLRTLLQMDGIHHLSGFVLPKVTAENVSAYLSAFRAEEPFEIMITLETADCFDPLKMAALRDLLLHDEACRRILSLRIGGNDLLQRLGLRRPRGRTLYATPLGLVITQLVTTFRSHSFNLTGPVFEYIDDEHTLRREVRSDLAHGLFGKTAIHPRQVPVIEREYRVSREELQMADRILDRAAPAVFRLHDAMCEPATHTEWALFIHERARIYGIKARESSRKGIPPKWPMPRNGTQS
jgi:citrate lyase beta subunit